jgi:hypothetical protein
MPSNPKHVHVRLHRHLHFPGKALAFIYKKWHAIRGSRGEQKSAVLNID